jgi:iron complex outermembrane receptor protein
MLKSPIKKTMTLLPLSVAITALSFSTATSAQDAPQKISLEEVTVTAERIETDLQDTPIAVTSLSSEQIEQSGAVGLENLSTFVPNLTISEDGDYGRMNPQFNIRGVGAGVPTAGVVTERPVGLYVDGVFLSRAQGSLLSVLDAENIQVLRGPQGTLFGRNTTGGAVAYTSKSPTDELEGAVKLTAGNYGRLDAELSANVPLGDTAALRAVYYNGNQDGFVDRGNIDLGNREEEVVRLQLRVQPSDDLTIDLSATVSDFETNGDSRVISEFIVSDAGLTRGHFAALEQLLVAQGETPLVDNDPRLVKDFAAPQYCILDDTDPNTFGPECDNSVEATMELFTSNIAWELSDEVTLKSITGYLSGDQSGAGDFPWSGAYNRPFDVEYESLSQEIQYLYNTDKISFAAGAIYYAEEGSEREFTTEKPLDMPFGGSLTAAELTAGEIVRRRDETYSTDSVSLGAYAQLTYSVTDSLDLTAGVRYSDDEKTVKIVYVPSEDDARDKQGKGTESWNNVDWRLAAAYNINENIMVYGSVSDAYKSGVADDSSLEKRNNPTNAILFVPPEEALGYEVGMRSEWMDNRLRVNLTAFKTDYTDRQSAQFQTLPDGTPVSVTVSLGDVNYEGFEGEISYAATESLRINASFGFVDYEQEDAPENPLPYVPEESFNVGLVHDTSLSSGSLTSSLTYGWSAEMWAESSAPRLESDPDQAFVESNGLLNGRVDYLSEDGRWSVAIFVNNITDEVYATSTSPQNFHLGLTGGADNATTQNLGRPRNYGMTVGFNF